MGDCTVWELFLNEAVEIKQNQETFRVCLRADLKLHLKGQLLRISLKKKRKKKTPKQHNPKCKL